MEGSRRSTRLSTRLAAIAPVAVTPEKRKVELKVEGKLHRFTYYWKIRRKRFQNQGRKGGFWFQKIRRNIKLGLQKMRRNIGLYRGHMIKVKGWWGLLFLNNVEPAEMALLRRALFTSNECTCHALGGMLETNYRAAQKLGELSEEYGKIPQFAIQQLIDSFDLSDSFGIINSVMDILQRIGVTEESNYKYTGIKQMVARQSKPGWVHYKAERFGGIQYDVCNKNSFQQLIDALSEGKTFCVRYIMYKNHALAQKEDILMKGKLDDMVMAKPIRDGKVVEGAEEIPIAHIVHVNGYVGGWSKKKKKWCGHWRAVNSWGENWGIKGQGKFDFELIHDAITVKLPGEVYKDNKVRDDMIGDFDFEDHEGGGKRQRQKKGEAGTSKRQKRESSYIQINLQVLNL